MLSSKQLAVLSQSQAGISKPIYHRHHPSQSQSHANCVVLFVIQRLSMFLPYFFSPFIIQMRWNLFWEIQNLLLVMIWLARGFSSASEANIWKWFTSLACLAWRCTMYIHNANQLKECRPAVYTKSSCCFLGMVHSTFDMKKKIILKKIKINKETRRSPHPSSYHRQKCKYWRDYTHYLCSKLDCTLNGLRFVYVWAVLLVISPRRHFRRHHQHHNYIHIRK